MRTNEEGMDAMTTDLAPLTNDETKRRSMYEMAIRGGLRQLDRAWRKVGPALASMQNEHLYRSTHPTFEKYCLDEYDIGAKHAYRLISSSGVADRLSFIDDSDVRETHVRPLVPLQPATQEQVWREVVDTAPDGKVTAKLVKSIVKKLAGGDPVPKPATTKNGKPPQHMVLVTKIRLRNLGRKIRELDKVCSRPIPEWSTTAVRAAVADLKKSFKELN